MGQAYLNEQHAHTYITCPLPCLALPLSSMIFFVDIFCLFSTQTSNQNQTKNKTKKRRNDSTRQKSTHNNANARYFYSHAGGGDGHHHPAGFRLSGGGGGLHGARPQPIIAHTATSNTDSPHKGQPYRTVPCSTEHASATPAASARRTCVHTPTAIRRSKQVPHS